ncbi:MAG: nucleoside triphosphate pyrophosphatase [Geoalkalibacter sp.]|jgi:septum formation protein|uniref:Maf family protein n=1 Tax=Geoalkalibacter sp. TaxID=3041440 RepID=UPI002A927B3B|nr:Maf family protein [Thermodesulfobacteriota bacterium]
MSTMSEIEPARRLILASTSPYRLQLLRRLGLAFHVSAPQGEENIDQEIAPELLVRHLAVQKARSLNDKFPDALIIGADQVFVDARGHILGKPGTFERAEEQLRLMSGKTHVFYTGLCVFDSRTGEVAADYGTYRVRLKNLTREQIHRYVRRENPVDCAGSFKVEGLGIALMERLEGDDYTTLIGLPLIKLVEMLERFGISVL